MTSFISIALKLFAAVGVGAAVYFGIKRVEDRTIESIQNSQSGNPPSPDPNNGSCCNSSDPSIDPNQNMGPMNTPPAAPVKSDAVVNGERIVNTLRVTQTACGKIFTLCQNLAIAIENVLRIFTDYNPQQVIPQPQLGGNPPQYQGGYYSPYPNNGYQDKYKDPPGFRRISPYIIEWVGDNPQQNGCW